MEIVQIYYPMMQTSYAFQIEGFRRSYSREIDRSKKVCRKPEVPEASLERRVGRFLDIKC